MIKATMRAWFQVTFIPLLLALPVGQGIRAQGGACPIHRDTPGEGLDDYTLCQARLGEQSERGEFEPGRDQARDRTHTQFRQRARSQSDKHIEQFRLLKLLELLDLREDQELEFITGFHSMRRELRELHKKKVGLINDLADGLRADTLADNEINRFVDEISQLGKQEDQVTDHFLDKARKTLTPSQLGRLVVFHERFELKLLESVKAFRERQMDRPQPPTMPEPNQPRPENNDSF